MFTRKVKQVITNKANIMLKNQGAKGDNPMWSISLGFYPGILFGMRTYAEEKQTAHVFYLPFIDLAIEIYK